MERSTMDIWVVEVTVVVVTVVGDTEVEVTVGAVGTDQAATEVPIKVPGAVGEVMPAAVIGDGTAGAIPGRGIPPLSSPLNVTQMPIAVKKKFVVAMDIVR